LRQEHIRRARISIEARRGDASTSFPSSSCTDQPVSRVARSGIAQLYFDFTAGSSLERGILTVIQEAELAQKRLRPRDTKMLMTISGSLALAL